MFFAERRHRSEWGAGSGMGVRRRVKSCSAWNHELRKDAREQNRQLLRGTVTGEGRSAALRGTESL